MESPVDNRLISIELRLANIERQLNLTPPVITKTVSLAAAPNSTASSYEFDEPPIVTTRPKSSGKPLPTEEKPGNWLGIIAILCFVLAAGFILKLSIDSGWLTPIRQVGLAGLLGFGLIGSGFTLMYSDRGYASLLPGAGVTILYLTVFAANRYYQLIPFEAALGLTGVIAALCVGLYWKIKHDIYPVVAALGAYIAPVILGLHVEAVFSVFYFLVASIGFMLISILMYTRTLSLISAYLAIVMTALIGIDLHGDQLISVALGLQFFIVAFGTYLYTLTNSEPLVSYEAWAFLPVLLIFYAAEYFYIDRLAPGMAPWVSLGFASVLIGFYFAATVMLPGNGETIRPVVLAYAAIVGFHSIYLELLPSDAKPWLFVAFMVVLVFSSKKFAEIERQDSFYIPGITLLVIAGIEYLSMAYHLITEYETRWLTVSLVSVGGLWSVLAFGDQQYLRRSGIDSFLLGAVHLLAILSLYRLTTNMGSLAVSASWLFYAVAVMAFAFIRNDELMAKSALAVLGFAAGKALLYDAASAPTVVRIFCLLLTGVVLYGCGFFMRRVKDWKNAT